uniref:Protein-tyrosine sulfotransferase n=1 Tax=Acrobeloides nanus TaxID=290746 RepID=A0A914D070_9BILA
MFPNAKFILMIRDGRAVVHSMIKRQVPVGGFNRSDPEQSLSQWNRTISQMYKQCVSLGSEICLMHEKFIGKEIKLSPHEFSTSQVKKKLNKEALKSWVGFYSQDLLEKMTEIAPMLNILGYDTASATPEYDKLPRI